MWRRGLIAALLLAACARDGGGLATPPPPAPKPVEPPAKPTATLPQAGTGMLAPSLARTVNAHEGAGSMIADVETCASCHSDVAAQWRKSAHAFASFNNPVYRVVVEKFRKDRGNQASHFCGGCHDPSLMVDGVMLGEIQPTDLRAHAGITCNTCHGITAARADGNSSYDLDLSVVPNPVEGDPDSNLRHRARVGRATLRTAAMCSTCHKAFLDPSTGNAAHLIGQDDATPWVRSAFAGSDAARIDEPVAQQDCRGCHMPRVKAETGDPGAKNGTIASHWFMGSHTWLASMQNDPELAARVQTFMQNRVSIDIGGIRHAGKHELVAAAPLDITPGEDVVVDVVLRNLDVGHRFPGGVMDAQDTWIELVVDDAKGRRVAEAGTNEEASGADSSAHVLSSYMAKEDGSRLKVRETHEFRAGVWNHTIPPRDAAVVGFGLIAPAAENATYPLKVSARLRHRTRNLELQKAACADTRSERGVSFGKVGLAKVARAIDACRPQPVTDLASITIALGAHAPARADEPASVAFARRTAYGLGLSHALQERLDDARLPYMAALDLASTPREKAIALGGLALVASRQGRTDETFGLAARADALAQEAKMAPPPSMQRARAEVLASTWRLAEAGPLFLDVAQKTPRDDAAWTAAAVTFGSAGDPVRALDAARRGLEAQPRDGDMLRIQALALDALHADDPVKSDAHAAFLDRRTPDEAPGVRGKCSAKVQGCANERVPVHVHLMRDSTGRIQKLE